MKLVLKAIEFAIKKHEGQFRKASGEPYVIHPIATSYLLMKYKQSKHQEELIAALILHDTLEDTDTNFVELATEFNPLIASIVLELTSDVEEIKKIGKNEYLKKKLCGISNYALVCKLLDRLHNISDNPKTSYIEDTKNLLYHIERNRKLTKTQKNIIRDIKEVVNGTIF